MMSTRSWTDTRSAPLHSTLLYSACSTLPALLCSTADILYVNPISQPVLQEWSAPTAMPPKAKAGCFMINFWMSYYVCMYVHVCVCVYSSDPQAACGVSIGPHGCMCIHQTLHVICARSRTREVFFFFFLLFFPSFPDIRYMYVYLYLDTTYVMLSESAQPPHANPQHPGGWERKGRWFE